MAKRIMSALLAAVFVLSAALVSGPSISAKDAWEKRSISYKDIEEIVDDSLDFSGQKDSLRQMAALLNQTKSSLDSMAQELSRQLAGMPEGSELRGIVQGLLLNTQALSAQVSGSAATVSQSISQIDSARDQLVVGVKNLFIAYNSLNDQRQELSRSLKVFDANLAAAEKQYELGMMTGLSLENVKQNRKIIISGMETMDFELKNLKRSMNTMIGRNYDDSISIGSLPAPDMTYAGKIKFRDDLEDAAGSFAETTIPSNHEDFEEMKGSFGASFRKLYENIGEKQRLLQEAEDALTLETKNLQAAQLQYDLGMLSQLSLINFQDQLDTQKAKVKTARNNLFTAIEQYKWAMEYGIVSI